MLCMILLLFVLIKFFFVLTKGRCKSKVCLNGKTALITGGYSGLGLETALYLASRGCRVIIADIEDLTNTKGRIIRETHNPNIVTKNVDFQSFKSVRSLAKDITETESRLDILVNNAGIGSKEMVVTEDGLSKTLQVNYFSHVLLTCLLIGLLKKSAPSRILFASSCLAFLCKTFPEDYLTQTKKDENEWKMDVGAYGNSKLLMSVAAVVLAKKLKNTGVTANAYHPGVVNTSIFNSALQLESNFFTKLLHVFSKTFGKNVEEGSQTIVYLACDNKVEKVGGKFFTDCVEWYRPKQTYNRHFCMKMWEATEKIIQLEEHERV